MRTIIGLAGRKQSGKSTLANALVDRHGFHRLSFTGPLRDLAGKVIFAAGGRHYDFGEHKERPFSRPLILTSNSLYILTRWIANRIHLSFLSDEQTNAIYHHQGVILTSPRHALQYLGNEIVRGCVDPDFWIHCLNLTVAGIPADACIVIDDVRYPNEVDYIRSRGGTVYWIYRPDQPDTIDTHLSENDITRNDCGAVLLNNGVNGAIFAACAIDTILHDHQELSMSRTTPPAATPPATKPPPATLLLGTIREVQDYNEHTLAVLLLDPSWCLPDYDARLLVTSHGDTAGTARCRGNDWIGHEQAILLDRDGSPALNRLDQIHLILPAKTPPTEPGQS